MCFRRTLFAATLALAALAETASAQIFRHPACITKDTPGEEHGGAPMIYKTPFRQFVPVSPNLLADSKIHEACKGELFPSFEELPNQLVVTFQWPNVFDGMCNVTRTITEWPGWNTWDNPWTMWQAFDRYGTSCQKASRPLEFCQWQVVRPGLFNVNRSWDDWNIWRQEPVPQWYFR